VTKTFDPELLDMLGEALDHIEWLTQRIKVSESGDAIGIVANAKDFLKRPDVYNVRVLKARVKMTEDLLEHRKPLRKSSDQ
jgi:hypothetical protein